MKDGRKGLYPLQDGKALEKFEDQLALFAKRRGSIR